MYLKGKDIKCPFDCLWQYYTRKFEATTININEHKAYHFYSKNKPQGFEDW